jgi:hypothetical protein
VQRSGDSSESGQDQAESAQKVENIRGLQFNLTIPDEWLTLTTDAKIAACAEIRDRALIGIGELNIFDPENPRLRLGGRNARPIHPQSAKRIGLDVYQYSGPRRLTTEMALNLVVRPSWIRKEPWPGQITHSNYESLPHIEFTDIGQKAANAGQVHVINGQHRSVSDITILHHLIAINYHHD